ncbi:unnamed protein product [Mytilus coruscus]|uniref:Tyrosinase copper-binding domain-containing protein n=1 Tax=Mytilus coruscus TaxID=42192 RepID=A0A6J8CZL5_MYTCO|nr:unnamed protein product [Mytilus coruscus]
MHAFILLILIIGTTRALIEEIPLPNELSICFESLSRKNDMTKVPCTEIQWLCMQKSLWRLVDHSIMNISDADRKWIDAILQIPDFRSATSAATSTTGTGTATGSGRKRRQAAASLRIRTEYRMLNDLERDQYHRAVNTLKQLPIGNVSRYDFIANIHRGDAIPVAHFSPNFLGWNRVYLLIYENALRQIDPTVTVPYFASDLDDPLDDPTHSVIWSDIFMGNGDGVVKTGPYGNWKTPSGPLVRNIGSMGQLLSSSRIGRILSKNRTEEISEPTAQYDTNLERQQYLVNRWIGGGGGQMSDLNSAAHDPAYFNHLAYVDYIWEQFRMLQRQKGINPAKDYPVGRGIPSTTEPIGFGTLQNIDGYSSYFTESVYTYEYLPECSIDHTDCGSVYLRCDTSVHVPRCVSLTRHEWNLHLKATGQLGTSPSLGGFSFGQSALPVQSNSNQCPSSDRGIQNRYRVDDMTDIREWVYIPVEILSRRPPEKTIYDSYPVFHSNVIYDGDVYSPDAYRVLRNTLHTVRLGKYDYCKDTSSNAGKIFIKSEGLNYYGSYQEYAIVDNRMALSSSTAYVAVRSPELGMTQTLITAHDSCGRMCSAYCKMKGRIEYQPCHGALQMTSATPKQYSVNFGEVIEDTWEFYKKRYFPRVKEDNVFIKFFCSYNEYWPKKIEKPPTVMSSKKTSNQNMHQLKSSGVQGGVKKSGTQVKPSIRLNTGVQPQRTNTVSLPQRTNTAPQQRTNTASQQRTNTAPQQRTNTAPQQRTNTAPQQRTNTAPQQRTNTAPQQRTNTATQQRMSQINSPPIVSSNMGANTHQSQNQMLSNSASTQNTGQGGIRNPGCLLGHGCIVAGSCRTCTHGQKIACIKSSTLFAHCQGTSLLIRRCLSNSRFDSVTGTCLM